LPIKFLLTPGQRNDITQAKLLSKDVSKNTMISDKGYDSDDFIESLIATKQCGIVIPSRQGRKVPREHDKYIYKERNAIECFFRKIKHFRRIFSRYDKSAQSYLSFLYLVGGLIWVRLIWFTEPRELGMLYSVISSYDNCPSVIVSAKAFTAKPFNEGTIACILRHIIERAKHAALYIFFIVFSLCLLKFRKEAKVRVIFSLVSSR
jgi:transposase